MSGDGGDLREAWSRFLRLTSEEAIGELLNAYPRDRSLYVDVLELYEFNESFTRGLFSKPDRYLRAGAEALREMDDTFDRVNVRLTNHPGLLGLENLRARHVDELVTLDGVVESVDPVQAIPNPAVFGCQRCGHAVQRRSRGRVERPGDCPECGARESFQLAVDRSTLVDVQRLRLEAPPAGNRSETDPTAAIDVLLDDDLVGTVGVGERLLATGVVRVESRTDSGRFDFYLDANAIDEEPVGVQETDDVSAELRNAITDRWELLTDR